MLDEVSTKDVPLQHIKLLWAQDMEQLKWLSDDLNLFDEADQMVLLERLEAGTTLFVGEYVRLFPSDASVVNVVIEYLITTAGLRAQEVSPLLREKANFARLLHLEKERHVLANRHHRQSVCELRFLEPVAVA